MRITERCIVVTPEGNRLDVEPAPRWFAPSRVYVHREQDQRLAEIDIFWCDVGRAYRSIHRATRRIDGVFPRPVPEADLPVVEYRRHAPTMNGGPR